MGERRFKNFGLGPLIGGFVFERIVPRDYSLVKLNSVVDWEAFVPILLPAYEDLAQEAVRPTPPLPISRCSSSPTSTNSRNVKPKSW